MESIISIEGASAGRDFNFIIEKLQLQEQENKRKTWTPLTKFQVPTTAFSAQGFTEMLVLAIAETFGNQDRPIEFVSLVDMVQAKGLTTFRFSSQHADLIDAACNRVARWAQEALQPDFNKDEAKARGRDEIAAILGDFYISTDISFRQEMNCVRIRCNRRSKTLSISSFEARSTQAEKYPGKFETASELLEYIAAIINSGPGVFIGDPYWIPRYSWVKFLVNLLDHHDVGLGRIRFNIDDPEEWDFENTELDYELGEKRGLRP